MSSGKISQVRDIHPKTVRFLRRFDDKVGRNAISSTLQIFHSRRREGRVACDHDPFSFLHTRIWDTDVAPATQSTLLQAPDFCSPSLSHLCWLQYLFS